MRSTVCSIENAKSTIIIDTMNLMWASATSKRLLNFTSKDGKPTGHIRGFYTKIVSVWEKYGNPNETALVFSYDAVGSSESRRELYPRYKTRKRERKLLGGLTPEEIRTDIFELIGHLPCYLLGGPRYEADDYIAAVTKTYKDQRHLVITRDKDLWALIEDKVDVLGRKKTIKNVHLERSLGFSNFSWIKPYKVLFGDDSDRIRPLFPNSLREEILVKVLPQFDPENAVDSLYEALAKMGSDLVQNYLSHPTFFERLSLRFRLIDFLPVDVSQMMTQNPGNYLDLRAFFKRKSCKSLSKSIPFFDGPKV